MRRMMLVVAVFALVFAAIPAGATTYTLTDQNSTAVVVADDSRNMTSWTVDGVNQLFQQSFHIQAGAGGAVNISNPTNFVSGATYNPGFGQGLAVSYNFNGLLIQINYTLVGGSAGSNRSDIAETIRITNTTQSAINDIRFFQYNDFDIGGLGGDLAQRVNANTIRQWDPNFTFTEVIGTPAADHYQIDRYNLVQNQIASLGYLSDTTVWAGPGDVTWAWEWDFDLGAGGSFLISKDKNVGPAVPEPGTMMLLGSGLVGLAGWGRKKFRK